MSLHAGVLHSKFCAAEASVYQGFLAALPGFMRFLNTGGIRFRKITLFIPQWHLTSFEGCAASNISLADHIRAKAKFRPSDRRLEMPRGNVAL